MNRPNDGEYLSEDQAHALWRRAAQLQAESAERREARTRLLASPEHVEEQAIHLSDVETAGVEAGIPAEFIRLARAETIANGAKPMSPRWETFTDRFLGSNRRLIEITRTFDARPRQILDAMGRVFPANPYYLNVVETLGEPTSGGVMVFDVTRRGEASTSFAWDMLCADIKQVLVTLRPAGDRTDVLLVASLNHSRRLNLAVGGVATGFAGFAGSAVGTAVGLGVLSLGALAALPAVAGAAGGAALLTASYRPLYRWGLGRGQRALEGLLRAVDLRLRTGGLIPGAEPTDDSA
jgi:hypothetical protein